MSDLLEYVRSQLEANKGSIRRIADDTGISYDTCLRIKNAEGDPGFSKIQRLAEYFGEGKSAPPSPVRPCAIPSLPGRGLF